MPQCKRDDCREPALIGGKRYCIEHMAAYKERQAKYAAVQKTLPDCCSGAAGRMCQGKVGPIRANAGLLACAECAKVEENAVDERRDARFDIESKVENAMGHLGAWDFSASQRDDLRSAFTALLTDE